MISVEYTLRKELPSAMFYLNVPVRDLLNRMIRWHIYLQLGEPVDMGILDSNMEILLEDNLFKLYKKTYSSADFNQIWKAYDAVTELWSYLGKSIAEKNGFRYPEWTPLFTLSAGVVVDTGGTLSHAAIVAREYGIPAVLATGVATSKIKDGDTVMINGNEGKVVII